VVTITRRRPLNTDSNGQPIIAITLVEVKVNRNGNIPESNVSVITDPIPNNSDYENRWHSNQLIHKAHLVCLVTTGA
jgi:hypothetical protein